MTTSGPHPLTERYQFRLLPHDPYRSAASDACDDCGAWVWDRRRHDRWHEHADTPTTDMGEYEDEQTPT